MMINSLVKQKYLIAAGIGLFMLLSNGAKAQLPILKVDLNIGSRSEAEVNQPGYVAWPISSAPDSMKFGDVSIAFKNGDFRPVWYKAGVQAPNYARLVGDGLGSESIEMHLSNLPAGKHSLVTFHNTLDSPASNTFSPMNVYLNDSLVVDHQVLTNRVLSNDLSTTVFLEFEVADEKDVVIRFEGVATDSSTTREIVICGFHLNAPDPKKMATLPYPEDKDEHVNIDKDTLLLQWKAPGDAKSFDVYLGTDSLQVALATNDSASFITNQSDTVFAADGFYSMNSYFWRIDPVDSAGRKTRGDVWYFKKRIPAFPEAGGYGRYAIGGRGGDVYYVTNLNDSGTGSFRKGVESATGPRTILFKVSGLITLESRLVISKDHITVAGQTAPGKGICIRWAPVGVTGDDLIVQNLRVRLGEGVTYDGMGLTGADHSIIDHCSISWTIDEAFSSRGAKNISLQRTLISEALNSANHDNYAPGTMHGYAASISGDVGSFHHNLLAHCYGRNWSLAGGLDGDGFYAGRLDIFNNVVYNWGNRTTDGGAHEVNFVNNYYKPGASTTMHYALNAQYDNFPGTQRYYFDGNVMPGYFDESNQEDGKTYHGSPQGYSPWVDAPFFTSDANIQSAGDAYKLVLSDVGCTQPVFDNHDQRIVYETLSGTYSYSGSKTNKPGLPDSESDVGYWEDYPGFMRLGNWDSDKDGLPNWWEKVHGLDTLSSSGDFAESNADPDRNGYTNLEEYLQWMAKPHYFVGSGEQLTVNLPDYSKGFVDAPVFQVDAAGNGIVSLSNDSVLTYTSEESGLETLTFTVVDAQGSTMTRDIEVYIGTIPADSAFEYTYDLRRDGGNGSSQYKLNHQEKFSLFPNPASDQLMLSCKSSNEKNIELTLIDLAGNSVMKNRVALGGRNKYTLNVSALTPGVYFVLVRTTNGSVEHHKFVKQ